MYTFTQIYFLWRDREQIDQSIGYSHYGTIDITPFNVYRNETATTTTIFSMFKILI